MKGIGQSLAIIIGINKYKNGIPELRSAVNDATKLSERLKASNYKVKLLLDGQATLEQLKSLFTCLHCGILVLENQEIQLTEDTRLIFYFAGHGIAPDDLNSTDRTSGYLVPQDGSTNEASLLSMRDLHDVLVSLSCRHLLLILDCCFAGSFRWASLRRDAVISRRVYQERYDYFLRGKARQVITSSAYDEKAQDVFSKLGQRSGDEMHNSPFATLLLQALDGAADLTKDGVITATELYAYLHSELRNLAQRQTPGLIQLEGHDTGEYIIWRSSQKLETAPALNENSNPYRGLKPYQREHSKFFFGRDRVRDALCDRLSSSRNLPLIIVLGVSGSGKSSLVMAGLIPHLNQNRREKESEFWHILPPIRPGEFPIKVLAEICLLLKYQATEAELSRTDPLSQALEKDNTTFEEIYAAWNHSNPLIRPILVGTYIEELAKRYNQADARLQQSFITDLEISNTECLTQLEALNRELQQNPQCYAEQVAEWRAANPNARLLLVIDQYEELVTMCRSSEQRQVFQEQIQTAIETHFDFLRIILTLRSDFEPRFLDSPLQRYWMDARFIVPPMTQDELREVIEKPAAEMVLFFESDDPKKSLVDQLINEVVQMPGALPLLSFTLSELYRKRQKRKLTESSYRKLGGVIGSLTKRANQEYENLLDEAHRATMRRVMLRMVTLEGGESARRRVPRSELVYSEETHAGENERVEKVIQVLTEARLIVLGQEAAGEAYIEPAHDVLVRGWNRIQDWTDKNLEELAIRQTLALLVRDWRKNPEDKSLLLPDGDRLNQLARILQNSHPWLNQQETEFITTSIEYRTEQRRLAEEQRQISEERRVRASLQQKSDRVRNLLPVQPQDGLLLALDAIAQNLRELPREILSSVQDSLHQAMETAREQDILMGHKGAVDSIAVSPDGEYIVSGSADGTVRVWDTQGNQICCLFQKEEDSAVSITSVAISSDGQYIVSGDSRGVVRLWDKQFSNISQPFQAHEEDDGITSIAIIAERQYIITASHDKTVRLWNIEGELIGQPLEHDDVVSSVAISSDGQLIVSGSWDTKVRLWNIEGELIGQPLEHNDVVSSVAISSDGQLIVSGSWDGTIQMWRTNGKPVGQSFKAHEGIIYSAAISLDGNYIVSSGEDKTVRLLDVKDNQLRQSLRGHSNYVKSVAISPNNQYIVSGGEDTTIRLWDTQGNQIGQPFRGHEREVKSVAFSRNTQTSEQYIVSLSSDNTLKLWDSQGNQICRIFEEKKEKEYLLKTVTISPDGQYIAVGSEDTTIRLWGIQGNQFGKPFRGHNDWVNSIAISSDGQYMVSGSEDTTVRLWDTQGNQIEQPFQGHTGGVNSVAISPDGQYIVSGSEDTTIRLWDTQGNQIGQPFQGHTGAVYSLAISFDGLYIVSGGGDKTVRFWHLGNWKSWYQICCNRLRYHLYFRNPSIIRDPKQHELVIEACNSCKQIVSSNINFLQMISAGSS